MASSRFPGPTCCYKLLENLDDGTLCRQVSDAPGPLSRFSLWPELHELGFMPAAFGMDEAITESDKAEFAIIKMMPVMSRRKFLYTSVNQYVADRTMYFGPPAAYAAFSAESDAELTNTKWISKKRTRTLRSMLEFDGKGQGQQQQIFYRWVRKAYKKKYGNDADVPEIIRKGMSKELEERLAAVRASVRVTQVHAAGFHAGGFNPRPVKQPKPGRKTTGKNYILGTLSEHATGMAIDIDDTRNAQFSLREWTFIEKLTGMTVKRDDRWATEDDAEALWRDIDELDKLFVKKVAENVKRIENERVVKEKKEKEEAAAIRKEQTTPTKPDPVATRAKAPLLNTPLAEVLGDYCESLAKWSSRGFFDLPLELVLEMHAHGFRWGATFHGNVDLHHFELKE